LFTLVSFESASPGFAGQFSVGVNSSLELIAHEALALTKMDWNNDALYDPVPVSIRYSQRLARTIANVQDLPRSVYPYRLFM
jgi:hypothetical protein